MQWKFYSVLLLFLLVPLTSADPLLQSQSLTSNLRISGQANVEHTGPMPIIDYIEAYLFLVPKEEPGQHIIQLTTVPQALGESTLRFTWEDTIDDVEFTLSSDLETTVRRPEINKITPFPLMGLGSEEAKYLVFTNNIDLTPEMKRTAASLATTNDQYEVVGRIATWIHDNIEYNLSTLTEEVVQPSSWVYEEGYGVCDEITSLFISMLRSIGIPARYVSGISYTNIDYFDTDWVSHAWAEVYFPEFGWVPFDISYGELGYVDATHIVLRRSVDSKFSSATYEYKANDISLSLQELDLDVTVSQKKGQHTQPLLIDVNMWQEHVMPGSSNVAVVTIKNPTDYYVMERLSMAKTELITIVTAQSWFVLLKPGETKRYYAQLEVSPNLVKNYEYIFPMILYDSTNASFGTEFHASRNGEFLTVEAAKSFISNQVNGGHEAASDGELECSTEHNTIYVNESTIITCKYTAPGKKEMVFCLDECQKIQHDVSSEVYFTKHGDVLGATTLTVSALDANTGAELVTFIPIRVSNLPSIAVTDLQYPMEIAYDDRGTISFTIEQQSLSPAEQLTLTITGAAIEQSWSYEEIKNRELVTISFYGRHLTKKENPITITITYTDYLGREYSKEKTFTIFLVKLSFSERLALWLNNAGRWITEAFS